VLLEKWPRWLRALHSLFYTTIVTFPFLVTIVYWKILYNGSWFPITFDAWSNVCVPTPLPFLPSVAPPPFRIHKGGPNTSI
jgi:hypothetical protein